MQDDIDQIVQFQEERDWHQFNLPKNIAIALTLEAGEVLELFEWTKDNNLPEGKKEKLAEELADVYYCTLLMAHKLGIDLKEAFSKKMEQNRKKYPVEKAKGKPNKYCDLE